MNPPTVVVVEDEAAIADTILYALRTDGMQAEHLVLGGDALQRLRAAPADLVILDVGLPDMSGFEVCRTLRTFSDVPVIFLTARHEEIDRIVGLEIGADDYVVKPFDPRELVARIRSVLRRNQAPVLPADAWRAPAPSEVRFLFSGWTLDTRARELRNPSDEEVPLSTAEYHLLRTLLEHPNRVLSRSQILDLTQRTDTVAFDRSIDSQISRLRKKLECDPRRPAMLKTVRGDGYLLATRVTVEKS